MTEDRYEAGDGEFWIVDQELKIDLQGPLGTEEKELFGSGAVRHHFYKKEEKLHGPSRFYSEEGKLLSETFYFEGKKEGKVRKFYPSGQLYSMERFVKGVPHLTQEYYYLDGTKKSVTSYAFGKLHGEVSLYWPDGQIKRASTFDRGEKKGLGKIYNEEGVLIGEA